MRVCICILYSCSIQRIRINVEEPHFQLLGINLRIAHKPHFPYSTHFILLESNNKSNCELSFCPLKESKNVYTFYCPKIGYVVNTQRLLVTYFYLFL